MNQWDLYYPVFQPYEFMCQCGCGLLNTDELLLRKLFAARTLANIPFHINSGCRCRQHNHREGGATDSAHVDGLAVDIRATTLRQRWLIMKALFTVGFPRIGLHRSFIHADVCIRRPQGVFFY